MHNRIRAIAALVAIGALAGCGEQGGSAETRERELERYAAEFVVNADVEVDESGEVRSVAVNSLTGGQVGSNLALPPGFPDDVLLHPSESVMSIAPAPGGGYLVQALSNTPTDELAGWHRSEMEKRGWAEQGGGGAGVPLSFMKDDRIASVNFIPNGDGVALQIMTMTAPN
jgi:hypothetical protein